MFFDATCLECCTVHSGVCTKVYIRFIEGLMQQVRIVWRDSSLVVLDKPAGLSVHPPESGEAAARQPVDLIRVLREQLGQWVYPVHRLDRATSGLMMMALDSHTAGQMQAQFQQRRVQKTYLALCRGWLSDEGCLDSPLSSGPGAQDTKPALTRYRCLHRFEIPMASGRFSTSRYSLVSAQPETGRWHQIRRHLKREAHPIVGDTVHGDGTHNRVWRELTGDQRLYLLSSILGFAHPHTGQPLRFNVRFPGAWHRVFDRAGACPLFS